MSEQEQLEQDKHKNICKRCGAIIRYAKQAPHMTLILHGRYSVFGKIVTMCEDTQGDLKKEETTS